MPDRPGDMDERDVDARFASIVAQWEHSAVDESDAVASAGAPVTDEPPAAPEARHEGAAEDTALEDAAPKDADAGAADSGASDAGASDPTAPAPRDPWVNPSPSTWSSRPRRGAPLTPRTPPPNAPPPRPRRPSPRRSRTSSPPRSPFLRRRTSVSGVPSSAWSPGRSCCSTSCSPARSTAPGGSWRRSSSRCSASPCSSCASPRTATRRAETTARASDTPAAPRSRDHVSLPSREHSPGVWSHRFRRKGMLR